MLGSVLQGISCTEEPSLFARYVATLVEPGRQMVELGCENGRDAAFFCDDFVNSDIHCPDNYDYAYSRFTIHAINQHQEYVLLNNLFCGLRPNGKLFIEVRGVNDPLFGKGKQVERQCH